MLCLPDRAIIDRGHAPVAERRDAQHGRARRRRKGCHTDVPLLKAPQSHPIVWRLFCGGHAVDSRKRPAALLKFLRTFHSTLRRNTPAKKTVYLLLE
jgi:hypothetical protein